jgi:predicted ATPase
VLHVELLRDRIADAAKYPFNLPAVRNLTKLSLHPKVTYFIGENGSGKSTLMEAIAVACGMNAEGGGRNFNFATRASHSELERCLRVAKPAGSAPRTNYFFRAESFYNVATEVEKLGPEIMAAYGDVSLHEQSHGESFFALFLNRFMDNGLYLLDEPEAALSPRRQLQFLALLHRYVKNGCQFLIATHSPILMAYPDARIYHLDADGIRETAYLDTDHFRITRGFLDSPARSLKELMRDDEEEK